MYFCKRLKSSRNHRKYKSTKLIKLQKKKEKTAETFTKLGGGSQTGGISRQHSTSTRPVAELRWQGQTRPWPAQPNKSLL